MSKPRHPATWRILEALRERIVQAVYPSGTWLPPERTLAEEFAVDRSVIRTALSALAEQGLIVRKAGHRPWVSDQISPKSRGSGKLKRRVPVRTVAAILPHDHAHHSSLGILGGINRVLRLKEAPYCLLVFDNYQRGPITADLERHALEAIEKEGVAGIILYTLGARQTLPMVQRLSARGAPVVFIDRYPRGMECDFVGVDNHHSAREAVSYLLDLGHTRIAHLTTSELADGESPTTIQDRAEGYCEALRLRNVAFDPEWIYATLFGRRHGPSAVEHFFALPDPPTAMFAVNDALAHAFIADVERSGRRVPEDISVIGFDDIDRFSPRPALLTTMQQPFELIGQRAAELLLRRLASDGEPSANRQHILLPTPLIVRSTCRAIV